MRRMSWMIALLLAGCGGSSDEASAPPSSEPQYVPVVNFDHNPGSDATTTVDANTPAAVVSQFYDAMRAGDDRTIASLLTDKARSETAKNGLEILSQGNPSLTYRIGKTEYVTENRDGAHVASLWTEPDERQQSVTTEVIWVLRKQTEGWRVAGFAQVYGDDFVLFDFEDPQHMLHTKEIVDAKFYGEQEEPPIETATPEFPVSGDTQLR